MVFMSTNPEVERRRVLLERVLDVESYWVAVARGGPYTEENRRKGERKLAVLIASLEGDESNRGVSDALADLPGVFAQNIGRGCSLLREVRISIRLDLDATTERLGLPRIPPAQVMTSDGKKIGRNTPCPCGSGKKFKRCCLLKKSKVN